MENIHTYSVLLLTLIHTDSVLLLTLIHSIQACVGLEALTSTTNFKKCGVKTSSEPPDCYSLKLIFEFVYKEMIVVRLIFFTSALSIY